VRFDSLGAAVWPAVGIGGFVLGAGWVQCWVRRGWGGVGRVGGGGRFFGRVWKRSGRRRVEDTGKYMVGRAGASIGEMEIGKKVARIAMLQERVISFGKRGEEEEVVEEELACVRSHHNEIYSKLAKEVFLKSSKTWKE
jgi:hypothetical protein